VKPQFFEQNYPPKKTNMAMENPRLEDVFPIEHGGFSNVMLGFRGVYELCPFQTEIYAVS